MSIVIPLTHYFIQVGRYSVYSTLMSKQIEDSGSAKYAVTHMLHY